MSSRNFILALLCAFEYLVAWSNASTSVHSIFSSTNQEDVNLRYVADSGVCETTPGVHQMSGYIDIGKNSSLFFWFFESRQSPDTAPFTLWLNGEPGCSSMVGLFQENGPCHVNPDSKTTTINPYSWNNISNNQPFGTGFSYGDITVNGTESAATFVWKAFQVLFESTEFAKYQSREFIFATESYGGYYSPAFVTYFDEQNAKIKSGRIQGEEIIISALMINNGGYDARIQYKSYFDFATYAPGYGQLQSNDVLQKINKSFYGANGCKERIEACYAAGSTKASNNICNSADKFCEQNIFVPAVGSRDDEDLRQTNGSVFPPEYYVDFLLSADVKAKIGVESDVNYAECVGTPGFGASADRMRTWLPQLAALAESRLRILLWAGDADINCNWLGVYDVVLAMDWYGQKRIREEPFKNMTINGKTVAAVQNVDNFSFARIYEAGHRVPAFQPQVALEILQQIIAGQPLQSV